MLSPSSLYAPRAKFGDDHWAWGGGGSVAMAVKVGSMDVILADAYFNKHVVESGTVFI